MLRRVPLYLVLMVMLPFASTGIARNVVPDDLVGSYLYAFEWGGTRLTLKADGTFIRESSNCTSVFTESGPYNLSDDILRVTVLKFTTRGYGDKKEIDLRKRKARKKLLDTDEPFKSEIHELRVVKWGPRVYLMNEGRFESFVDAINLGFEPRHIERYRPFFGEILLREGDENKDVSGVPLLPGEFLSMLLTEPVVATVMKIENID